MNYHTPVLLSESLKGLNIRPEGTYVDATFGGGGHSLNILNHLTPKGKLFAFDQDEDTYENVKVFEKKLNFQFIKANFKYLRQYLDYYGVEKIDGILIDLGVSSHQIDSGARGFSIKYNGPLDMRMSASSKFSAYDLINQYSQDELFRVLTTYGELRQADKLVQTIFKKRQLKAIKTTYDLVKLIRQTYSERASFRLMAQIFQAFRIEINHELEALKILLMQLPDILKPKARVITIAYHSLEDRLIKFFFKTGNFEGHLKKDSYGHILRPLKPVCNRVMKASASEIERNKRARSARLRIATTSKS